MTKASRCRAGLRSRVAWSEVVCASVPWPGRPDGGTFKARAESSQERQAVRAAGSRRTQKGNEAGLTLLLRATSTSFPGGQYWEQLTDYPQYNPALPAPTRSTGPCRFQEPYCGIALRRIFSREPFELSIEVPGFSACRFYKNRPGPAKPRTVQPPTRRCHNRWPAAASNEMRGSPYQPRAAAPETIPRITAPAVLLDRFHTSRFQPRVAPRTEPIPRRRPTESRKPCPAGTAAGPSFHSEAQFGNDGRAQPRDKPAYASRGSGKSGPATAPKICRALIRLLPGWCSARRHSFR